jgi:hypothetical protein
VFAIWLPMLAGDSRSAWDRNVLNDPRVKQFWDGDRISGRWFADRQIGGLGGPGSIVWDAYYAFASDSTWAAAPNGTLAAGSDIIDNVSGLEHSFIPLLVDRHV